jgi:hypothetical protein
MGGWGSGREEYATTPTVEECRSIDMDDLKEITEHVDARGELYWGGKEDPDSWLKWRTEGETTVNGEDRPERVRFIYTTTYKRNGREVEKNRVNYAVPVDYTEPNYGGVRPWFICPECTTRRRKLYLPRKRGYTRYLCRECYDLVYTSSRSSGNEIDRARQRYKKAFAKADAENRAPHPNNAPYTPDRPKGMHQETFAELRWEVTLAEMEYTEEVRKKTNRLLESSDYLADDSVTPIPPAIPDPAEE